MAQLEEYPSGRRGGLGKLVGVERCARVRIPIPPPVEKQGPESNHSGLFVTFAGEKENGLAPATCQIIIGILLKNDVPIDDSSFFDNFVLIVNYPFSRLHDS